MFWSRLVGWFECVAFADPSAVQRHQSRDPRNMEIPVSTGGNSYLPAGIWISVFYLEHQDTKDLAPRRVRDARRYRSSHGNVPFFARHDRSQPGRVPDGFVCADETNPFTA